MKLKRNRSSMMWSRKDELEFSELVQLELLDMRRVSKPRLVGVGRVDNPLLPSVLLLVIIGEGGEQLSVGMRRVGNPVI